MNTKNNRQFQGSDLRMKQAMLELMKTTSFEKITVRLLCEKAGVNRSTFYAHYKDLYDMIQQMGETLQKELLNDYPDSEEIVPLSLESLITFLTFIRKHRSFYQVSLKLRQEFPLQQRFLPLWEQVVRPFCLKAGITDENEMIFYLVGFQAGFSMILNRWVTRGCVESEEKIAQIIRNFAPPIWKVD